MYTRGFESPWLLSDHYDKHRSDFEAASEEEYEELADTFLGGPKDADTLECIRTRNGDCLRYNKSTREFGVLSNKKVIKSYYKPSPQKHGEATNEIYFSKQCKQ